jgi:site-specific DNA recombinase
MLRASPLRASAATGQMPAHSPDRPDRRRRAGQAAGTGEGLDVHDRDPLATAARCHMRDQLFPAEQARILQLLVERVIVRLDGLEIRLRVEGISSLVEDLRRREPERTAA